MAKHDIPIIGPLLNKLIGSRNERFVKKYLQRVNEINAMEPRIRALTDAQIRSQILVFRERIEKGANSTEVMSEAFAFAREAMDRSVGIRNIFNPVHADKFDPSRLPEEHRATYERVKAELATQSPLQPVDDLQGCAEPVHPYVRVELPPTFYDAVRALYAESRPPFRARPFDVQLIGAMVLYQGRISEMKTGEGKTIVAPLACYLACAERLKVHVVTVNDYLVQRDRDWTFPFFHALGLTVGAIHPQHMQSEDIKRTMYQCDVVYGTTAEFGFDYLRDNMKRSAEQQVQRRREFAIVDEVDSILIDEARTPLIISGAAHEDKPRYELADRLARGLVEKQKPWQAAEDEVENTKRRIKGFEGDIRTTRDKSVVPGLVEQIRELKTRLPALEAERARHTQYYETHMERKSVHLTHAGITEAQRVAGVGSFYVGENMDLPHLLEQALRAHVVYQRDRDYIVAPSPNMHTGRVEPSVIIVDINTGRPMVGRQWSDGLHQAVECKEAVPIKDETQTVATITIQNFFKMYKRLAGMTGTADTEAQEFHDIYKLDVVTIPTNKPVTRRDFDDMVFVSMKDKWSFIVDEIRAFHDAGRPILVGTTSVEKSETLGRMLTQRYGIRHEILNAKQHEREAHIVEHAGELGQVMIATNMAGRGTDIKLGTYTREQLLDHWLRRGICPREVTADFTDEQLREAVYRKIAPTIKDLGLSRQDAEKLPFADLELRLLRFWAMQNTWISSRSAESASADELRRELDRTGRFLLHRIRWFKDIEDMGGLHVIGTERHESRRIDNQLRGRSGRQGDKGSSRFFISLDDDLMKLFAGEKIQKWLAIFGMKEGDAIEHRVLSNGIESAQRKVEELHFQRRKNILEYDEVMEHQRQRFYGLRQRVLENRDLKGLIFEFITDSTSDAVGDFLHKDYAVRCVAEFARQRAETTIIPTRLRGLEGSELADRIREYALADITSQITITLGEYLPDTVAGNEGAEVDFDGPGLMKWARDRFGVELVQSDLEPLTDQTRQRVRDRLVEAAEAKVRDLDLSGLDDFLAPDYGARQLCSWAKNKFGFELDTQQVFRTSTQEGQLAVAEMIFKQARELYRKREVEYPIDFAMDMTMTLMRQNPQEALAQLVAWANTRYQLGWTAESVRSRPPSVAREELLKASERFVDEGGLDREVHTAAAITDPDALAQHFRTRFNTELPESIRHLKGQERNDAVRSRVEGVLRAELAYFEKTLLLETLDSSWKDHLYAMDQLRDSINFRAFSQQDPRIEYKREGSRMFNEVLRAIREKVTDYIFKLRLTPQFAPPAATPSPIPTQVPPAPRPQPLPDRVAAAPASRPLQNLGAGFGSTIAGPGFAPAPSAPTPMSEQAHKDLEAAQAAGTPGAPAQQTSVKTEPRYGRNDPCPQGSGTKYKRCCNKPNGTCDGSGLTKPQAEGDTSDD